MWVRLLVHVAFPPLVLLWPRKKTSDSHDVEDGHDKHHGHGHGHGHGGTPHPHSALAPIVGITLMFLTFYRFAAVEGIGKKGAEASLLGPFHAPDGWDLLVFLFWSGVLYSLVLASWESLPIGSPKVKFKDLLLPELLALYFLFLADSVLAVYDALDADKDNTITYKEVVENWPLVIGMLPRRWLFANFTLLVSITIERSIAPKETSKTTHLVFDGAWLLLLTQFLTLFVSHSVNRGDAIVEWDSTIAGVLYGFRLYFFTHSLALMSAVVFRSHVGASHPPTVPRVAKLLGRHRPKLVLVCTGFLCIVLVCLIMLPGLADMATHMEQAEAHKGQEPDEVKNLDAAWLQAMSQDLCDGPWSALTTSLLNVAVLAVVLDAKLQPLKLGRPSFEASLTIGTGCLAVFCWVSLLCPDPTHTCPYWKRVAGFLGAVTHVVTAAFSADAFSERRCPGIRVSVLMTFWAAFQVLRGLGLEHAGALHHGHGGMPALLQHIGAFGLCEFGLIITLGWITYMAEIVHHQLHHAARHEASLKEPLLGHHNIGSSHSSFSSASHH